MAPSSDFELLLVFTAHIGGLLTVCGVLAYEGWTGRSRAAYSSLLYLLMCAVCAVGLSGVVEHWVGAADPGCVESAWTWWWALAVAVTAASGIEGVRDWLGFPWRGQMLDRWLRVARALNLAMVAIATVGAISASTWAPQWATQAAWLLVAAVVFAVAALLLCAWVCWEVMQVGDQLARIVLLASVLQAPALAILGAARAADWTAHNAWPQNDWGAFAMGGLVLGVVLHVVASVAIAWAAFKQGSLYNRRRRALERTANFDALARLPHGPALVAAMEESFGRAQARQVPVALLIVNVYNHDQIAQDRGAAAATQVLLATLARVQAAVNPRDLLGRYFDSCFVVMVRAQVDAQYLRNLALRLASNVGRDVALRGRAGDQTDNSPVVLDASVGICWSDRMPDIKSALRHAATAASEARRMIPPAAVCVYPEMPPLPVERVLGASPQGQSARDLLDMQDRTDSHGPFEPSIRPPLSGW